MIFDIVLRSRTSGEGGHRAEADWVIRGSQNLAQAVHHGGGTRSRRIPKGSRYVTQQRKVAFLERPLIFDRVKYDGASRGNHAAYFPIHVLSRVLSGASRKTRISRVRRSNFAAVVSLATTRNEGGATMKKLYWGDFVRLVKRIARWLLKKQLRRKKFLMRPDDISRSGLAELISELNHNNIVMVEIGSYRGESAEIFLETNKVAKIYCVDPWKMFYDPDDGASFTDMAIVEADFDRRQEADSRIVKVKGTIDVFVDNFINKVDQPCAIDMVYIDGLHTYEGVKHDIEMTVKYIRPRIAIAGHDYSDSKNGGTWPGVVRAIHETIGIPDKTFPDGSWLKRTRPISHEP